MLYSGMEAIIRDNDGKSMQPSYCMAIGIPVLVASTTGMSDDESGNQKAAHVLQACGVGPQKQQQPKSYAIGAAPAFWLGWDGGMVLVRLTLLRFSTTFKSSAGCRFTIVCVLRSEFSRASLRVFRAPVSKRQCDVFFSVGTPSLMFGNPPAARPDPSTRRHSEPATNEPPGGQEELTPLSDIDYHFQQIGCLGHGGFGSVFLAKKQSGRRVALKFIALDPNNHDNNDDRKEMLRREFDTVLRLECTRSSEGLAIIYFEDWFIGDNYACIVMQNADGGTLAEEILAKHQALDQGQGKPYTERRIASYAFQLSSALQHAHSRGVAHQDIKSSNILIDRTGGGKLLLADFGSAVSSGRDAAHITEIYAPPELLRARSQADFSGLDPTKVDVYGLGCVLFELLCCKKLVDLTTEQTLAEYIVANNSAEAALALPCIQLPFLPEMIPPARPQKQTIGYTRVLKSIVTNLLQQCPSTRSTSLALQTFLKKDPASPLLQDYLPAAQPPQPGAPVTVDNIQLGMFVQRGPHWVDGDSDGGINSVGVVVKLDSDAGYTEVAFPLQNPTALIFRIGAGNKFELAVGPPPGTDIPCGTYQAKTCGILDGVDPFRFAVGQSIGTNCMVVGAAKQSNRVFVAPTAKIAVSAPAFTHHQPLEPPPLLPKKALPEPDNWQPGTNTMPEVIDALERQRVLDAFFSENSGMGAQDYEVLSIQRIQNAALWRSFADTRESVAAENWGIANEKRLFMGTGQHSPAELLLQSSPLEFFTKCIVPTDSDTSLCFTAKATFADQYCHRPNGFMGVHARQVVLSRVALGRTKPWVRPLNPLPSHSVNYHSELVRPSSENVADLVRVTSSTQAYPEYIISYRQASQHPGRPLLRARRPERRQMAPFPPRVNLNSAARPTTAATPTAPPSTPTPTTPPPRSSSTPQTPRSSTKSCVVCMENDVSVVLVPCGHPCLCKECATFQGLMRLRNKCPECRNFITRAMRMYGRVVED
ncbi:RECEPTOR-LIKE PROTEIN KINASE-like 1 [Seminavis robusta]|uniref:NEK6-subfamily protein kinase n=1 Tax=Seminavis robusta TaxID=568900 RepID=A0A9N8E2T6_9STRA|nr:RECEPTOR-LIKE PROTEIN KINASE-like 1 [Seminavis robusta]|eukprot:Sro487_g152850.1 RECEPTOR-LIKE PROTEIN KINASE-like 1 (988) ;mRNA; r:25018-28358